MIHMTSTDVILAYESSPILGESGKLQCSQAHAEVSVLWDSRA